MDEEEKVEEETNDEANDKIDDTPGTASDADQVA